MALETIEQNEENMSITYQLIDLNYHYQAEVDADWKTRYGVSGHLKILEDDVVIFEDPHMAIIELALDLLSWKKSIGHNREDYFFESIHSEDIGIVWIKKTGGSMWKIGSVWNKGVTSREYKLSQIDEFIIDYSKIVNEKVYDTFGLDF